MLCSLSSALTTESFFSQSASSLYRRPGPCWQGLHKRMKQEKEQNGALNASQEHCFFAVLEEMRKTFCTLGDAFREEQRSGSHLWTKQIVTEFPRAVLRPALIEWCLDVPCTKENLRPADHRMQCFHIQNLFAAVLSSLNGFSSQGSLASANELVQKQCATRLASQTSGDTGHVPGPKRSMHRYYSTSEKH